VRLHPENRLIPPFEINGSRNFGIRKGTSMERIVDITSNIDHSGTDHGGTVHPESGPSDHQRRTVARSGRFARRVRSVLGWALLALAGLCAWQAHRILANQGISSATFLSPAKLLRSAEQRQAERLAELRRHLEKAVSEAFDRNAADAEQVYERFLKDLEKANPHFDRATSSVGPAVSDLCSMDATKEICFRMIRDALKKTNSTSTYLQEKTDGYVTHPCTDGVKQVEIALAAYRDAMQRSITQLNTDLAQIAQRSEFAQAADLTPLRDLIAHTQHCEKLTTDIATASTFSGAGLVAAAVAPLVKRVVGSTISPIVKRFLAKSSLISWLPIADGPFPIGDAIFVTLEAGFIAWDAKNLYDARFTMRNSLTQQLRAGIDRCRTDSRNGATERAGQIRRLLEQHRQAIQGDLLQGTSDATGANTSSET